MPPKQDRPKTDPTQAQWLTDEFEKKLIKLFEKAKGQLKDLLQEDDAKTNTVAPNIIKTLLGKVDKTFDLIYTEAEEVISEEIPKGYQHGERYASIQLGASPEVRKVAWTKIGNRVINAQSDFKKITDATAGTIRSTIADGIINEWKFSEITRDILRNVDGIGIVRAETMVRSEIMQAVNGGIIDRYKKDDVEKVEFLAAEDELVCDECSDLDGKIFNIDEVPDVPVHPNCLLPDTRLESVGDIIAGLRAWYNGPVVEVTATNGSKITVTPNHMFLTPDGFIAADLLHKGDNIIYRTGFERVIFDNPDNHGNPSTIENIIKALSEKPSMFTCRVPTSSEDLHGDASRCNTDIDIIRPNSLLGYANDPFGIKQFNSGTFDPGKNATTPSSLSGCSSLAELLHSIALTSDGSMSGIRQSAPLFRGRLRHTQEHRLASTPGSNPPHLEANNNPRSCNTKSLTELLDRNAGIIELQKVININIIPSYHGIVYDVQTLSTLCIGNGFILSNCRCTFIPKIDIPGEKLDIPLDIEDAESTDEINQWFGKNYPDVKVDLSKMDYETAKTTAVQFNNLCTEYENETRGTLKEFVVKPFTSEEQRMNIYAAYGEGTIQLNPEFFGEGKTESFTQRLYMQAGSEGEQAFHPTGCTTPESIVTHEFAHLYYDGASPENKALIDEWSHREGAKLTGNSQYDTRKDAISISSYAATNPHELFAETFAGDIHGMNRITMKSLKEPEKYGTIYPDYKTMMAKITEVN